MAVLPQMKLLINLARIDGRMAEREQNYIINIARANGIYPDEIYPLFDQQHALIIPEDLTNDERFDYLYSLIQLMKIDERMYKEELMFCSKIAVSLGYHQHVLFEMMLNITATDMTEEQRNAVKLSAQKYLKSNPTE